MFGFVLKMFDFVLKVLGVAALYGHGFHKVGRGRRRPMLVIYT